MLARKRKRGRGIKDRERKRGGDKREKERGGIRNRMRDRRDSNGEREGEIRERW